MGLWWCAGGYGRGAGARRWGSAADAAASARRALEEGDEDWAFRLIVQARDHLRRLDPVDVALWAEEPPSIGDRRFDVLLARRISVAVAAAVGGAGHTAYFAPAVVAFRACVSAA